VETPSSRAPIYLLLRDQAGRVKFDQWCMPTVITASESTLVREEPPPFLPTDPNQSLDN